MTVSPPENKSARFFASHYWMGVAIGAGASALFMEFFSEAGFRGLILVEAAFYFLAAICAIALSPKNTLGMAVASLFGVPIGVLLNVLFHPTNSQGFERNLFPFEMITHTAIALVPMLLAVVLWVAIVDWRIYQKSKKKDF